MIPTITLFVSSLSLKLIIQLTLLNNYWNIVDTWVFIVNAPPLEVKCSCDWGISLLWVISLDRYVATCRCDGGDTKMSIGRRMLILSTCILRVKSHIMFMQEYLTLGCMLESTNQFSPLSVSLLMQSFSLKLVYHNSCEIRIHVVLTTIFNEGWSLKSCIGIIVGRSWVLYIMHCMN